MRQKESDYQRLSDGRMNGTGKSRGGENVFKIYSR